MTVVTQIDLDKVELHCPNVYAGDHLYAGLARGVDLVL